MARKRVSFKAKGKAVNFWAKKGKKAASRAKRGAKAAYRKGKPHAVKGAKAAYRHTKQAARVASAKHAARSRKGSGKYKPIGKGSYVKHPDHPSYGRGLVLSTKYRKKQYGVGDIGGPQSRQVAVVKFKGLKENVVVHTRHLKRA